MPGRARKDVVASDELGFYHCHSRCVRRSFLCGEDRYTGKNYDHRKQWIEDRMQFLAGWMAVEVAGFAVMENHLHCILRIRPDLASAWSDEEVARRWLMICPGSRQMAPDEPLPPPTQAQIDSLVSDRARLTACRARLSSLSWFMKLLKEPIARWANREDDCTGCFWEGRFHCTRLLDVQALLLCLMYVDLNPVRAGLALTPESSSHTSAYRRIQAHLARQIAASGPAAELETAAAWLSPIDESGPPPDGPQAERGRRASDLGILPFTLEQYLQLLDWSGREVRRDKRGAIPAEFAPILMRLQIDQEEWLVGIQHFGRCFADFAGSQESMRRHAAANGHRWYQGSGHAQMRPAAQRTR